jgi:hypothetical protein
MRTNHENIILLINTCPLGLYNKYIWIDFSIYLCSTQLVNVLNHRVSDAFDQQQLHFYRWYGDTHTGVEYIDPSPLPPAAIILCVVLVYRNQQKAETLYERNTNLILSWNWFN